MKYKNTAFGKIGKKDNKCEVPYFGKVDDYKEDPYDDENGSKKKRRADAKKITDSEDQTNNNPAEATPTQAAGRGANTNVPPE
jgi:hypothetical protein